MSTPVKILLGLFFAGALFAAIAVVSVISINNELVEQEAGLDAQYKQDQNNYDNFTKKVVEVAQVPAMMRDDLVKITKAAISGRYGADGSKAVFQFIKEQNPNVSPEIYTKIQQVIDAGRTSFEAEQKMLLDKKRLYVVQLNSFPTGFVARMLGFPKIDLTKIDIVTSDDTDKAFTTKKAKPLNVRDEKAE
jgi:hypothetical protein